MKEVKELQQAKEIFLTDVDEETYAENLEQINEWESSLRRNKAYDEWKKLDITQEINKKVRETYKDIGIILALNRTLTEAQRQSLYAKQDACVFILELTDQNAKQAINALLSDIKHKINATR